MRIVPSLEAAGIIELLRQVRAEDATSIDVHFMKTREKHPEHNHETGLWVEYSRQETYKLTGANCKKIYDFGKKLRQASNITVIWRDYEDPSKTKTMTFDECYTKVVVSGFLAMPFDLTRLDEISPYPREVVMQFH